MSHKIEFVKRDNQATIKLDGQDISDQVADWSISFSQQNVINSQGKSPIAVVLRRFVYVGKDISMDDSGAMVYNQILYDVEISVDFDGKLSKLVAPAPGFGLKGLKK